MVGPNAVVNGCGQHVGKYRVDVECSVCESALFSMQHRSFELSHSQTRVLHNL